MVIDIISYTDQQFAALSEEQLLEVKEAQLKKNKLYLKLEKNLQKEKAKLSDNGILRSELWTLLHDELWAQYEAEVELIREGLLFYLRFSSKPSGEEEETVDYEVNYALTDTERFNIVKTYYETTYTDGAKRFEAFKADKVAPQYLGELYAPLYDYFLEDA